MHKVCEQLPARLFQTIQLIHQRINRPRQCAHFFRSLLLEMIVPVTICKILYRAGHALDWTINAQGQI